MNRRVQRLWLATTAAWMAAACGDSKTDAGAGPLDPSLCNPAESTEQVLNAGACVDRRLVADRVSKLVPCDLVELHPGAPEAVCEIAKGRQFLEVLDGDSGEPVVVCRVNQLAVNKTLPGCESGNAVPDSDILECVEPNSGADAERPSITQERIGWFFDDFSSKAERDTSCRGRRIACTEAAEPKEGIELRLSCSLPPTSRGDSIELEILGQLCETPQAAQRCAEASTDSYTTACEGRTETRQISCEVDANCPRGWVCFGPETPGFCTNPECILP